MTPGFAKRRDELPYLPYVEPNKVIINSHNFPTGGGNPYAVNGKTPIAAWIPTISQDMTDLISGTFDATLSGSASINNDGGGLYSLLLPNASSLASIAGAWVGSISSISGWIKISNWGSNTLRPIELQGTSGRGFALLIRTTQQLRASWTNDSGSKYNFTNTTLGTGWLHFVVNLDSNQFYINGSSNSSTASNSDLYPAANKRFIGLNSSVICFDDIRAFGVELDSSDRTYLGTRGVTA